MTHPDASPPIALSLAEVSRRTSLSRRTLHRHIKAGKLRTVKLGGRRLVLAEELARLLGLGEPIAAAVATGSPSTPPVSEPGGDMPVPQPAKRPKLSELLAKLHAAYALGR